MIMGKENNLTDFLTDIADAIREKKGSSEKVNPQDFASEIRSIEGGGETTEVYVFGETMIDAGGGVHTVKKVRVADGVQKVGGYRGNYSIEYIEIPDSVSVIVSTAFYGMASLKELVLPEAVSAISASMCYNCVALERVECKGNIVQIYGSSLSYCGIMNELLMTNNTVVPTLRAVNALGYNPCKIVIPDNLYDEWITATNWVSYGPEGSNQIVKASEYNQNE